MADLAQIRVYMDHNASGSQDPTPQPIPQRDLQASDLPTGDFTPSATSTPRVQRNADSQRLESLNMGNSQRNDSGARRREAPSNPPIAQAEEPPAGNNRRGDESSSSRAPRGRSSPPRAHTSRDSSHRSGRSTTSNREEGRRANAEVNSVRDSVARLNIGDTSESDRTPRGSDNTPDATEARERSHRGPMIFTRGYEDDPPPLEANWNEWATHSNDGRAIRTQPQLPPNPRHEGSAPPPHITPPVVDEGALAPSAPRKDPPRVPRVSMAARGVAPPVGQPTRPAHEELPIYPTRSRPSPRPEDRNIRSTSVQAALAVLPFPEWNDSELRRGFEDYTRYHGGGAANPEVPRGLNCFGMICDIICF